MCGTCQQFTVVEPALQRVCFVELTQRRHGKQPPEGDGFGQVAMDERRVDANRCNVNQLLGSKVLARCLRAQITVGNRIARLRVWLVAFSVHAANAIADSGPKASTAKVTMLSCSAR